jgi:hypothetical protein
MKATVTVTTYDGISIAATCEDGDGGNGIADAVMKIRESRDGGRVKLYREQGLVSKEIAEAIGDFFALAKEKQSLEIMTNGIGFKLVMKRIRRLMPGEGV